MTTLNISSFIWGIADDVLRDVYVRGKYRDVTLPMTVIRRLDAVLEPTKQAVVRKRVDRQRWHHQPGGRLTPSLRRSLLQYFPLQSQRSYIPWTRAAAPRRLPSIP